MEKYREMAEMTNPECGKCRIPYSCCSVEYCEMARDIAKNEYGIDLKDTGHPKLPFMGETGCIVPPHLRPLCSLHTCDISSLGFKKGDFKWTEKYFKLRSKIDRLEFELQKTTRKVVT